MGTEEKAMSRENWGRGNIYTRGTRLWIRYPVDGKYRFESVGKGKTQEQARRLLEKRLVEVEKRELPAPQKEQKRTINYLFDALEKDYEARECDSSQNLKSVLKPLREALGDRRATGISTDDLTAVIVGLRKDGYSDASIDRMMRSLRQAYTRQEAIWAPKFPELPKGRARDFLIEPAQQPKLIDALNDECFRDMARFHFATGWRGKEIRLLEWRHIRDETIRLVAENSKTDEARDFPLFGAVAEIIDRRRAARSLVTPFVFHRKNKRVDYRAWLRAWHAAAAKAGLAGAKPHDSRRSFATETLDSGADLHTTMALTGHRTDSMIKRYHIPVVETLKRAIERREEYAAERVNGPKVVSLAEVRQKVAKS
jgi:integrase